MSRLVRDRARAVARGTRFLLPAICAKTGVGMSNDNPATSLDSLRAEHRQLDERIRGLSSEPTGDQLELARLKRRKLMLKDQIQRILDSTTPDIIA